MNYETAKVTVPLMDAIVRWQMSNDATKNKVRDYIATAGFEPQELLAITTMLDTLDA